MTAKPSEVEVLKLHGMGPKAVDLLRSVLKEKGRSKRVLKLKMRVLDVNVTK